MGNYQKTHKRQIVVFTEIFIISLIAFSTGNYFIEAFGETTQEWKEECNKIAHEGMHPHVVSIDLELIDIGQIDRDAGTFEADFWLRLMMNETKNNGKGFSNLGALEPDFNGRLYDGNGKTIDHLDDSNQSGLSGISYYEQRKQGVFYSNMDFHNFPFEVIEFKLELEAPDLAP